MVDMNFLHYIRQAYQIVLLNKKCIRQVANDKDALLPGIIFFAAGSAAVIFVQYLARKTPVSIPLYIPFFIFAALLMLGAVHLLARLFGSKEKFISFLRPTLISSLFSIMGLLTLTPVIGPVFNLMVSIWSLVIFAVVIKESYKLSMGKTVGILLLMFLAMIVAIVVIAFIVGIAMVAQNPGLFVSK